MLVLQGWTTFLKPKRLTAPLERSFTGKFAGSASTNTTWEPFASVTFQDDLTTGKNGQAFEGNCENKATPAPGLLFGLSCQDVGPDVYGFCAYDGSPGAWYSEFGMGRDVDVECLARCVRLFFRYSWVFSSYPLSKRRCGRYIHIHMPYTTGYDGVVGGFRSLTLAEIEVSSSRVLSLLEASLRKKSTHIYNIY